MVSVADLWRIMGNSKREMSTSWAEAQWSSPASTTSHIVPVLTTEHRDQHLQRTEGEQPEPR
ncbi:hypothetical protein F7725_012565 [Dissostichus mawsoni]|uniref:Uncharacterized protein n=1 Tax=Dissostichus mawsoni TaxID=36200 RepID=A0A7J5YNT5_DISMA|nr:hypothetical protein F7725_012565 [Dissostichus mawsoni]